MYPGPEGNKLKDEDPDLDETPAQWEEEDKKPPGLPPITLFLLIAGIAVSVLRFIGVSVDPWLVPRALEIRSGAWWGVITSIFPHGDPLHLMFNMYWLVIFGSVIERVWGQICYLLFVILAALVSSTSQIAFSGETGIGFSGVGYAMFGLLLIARKHVREFSHVLNQGVIKLFLVWFVLCFALDAMGAMRIGNAAHAGGLVFGAAAGQLFLGRSMRLAGWCSAGVLVAASIAFLLNPAVASRLIP